MRQIVLVFLLTLTSCSSDSTVYITGAPDTQNATVSLDGKFCGTMSAGKDTSAALLIVRTNAGKHTLTLTGRNGEQCTKTFIVNGETYIDFDFSSCRGQ